MDAVEAGLLCMLRKIQMNKDFEWIRRTVDVVHAALLCMRRIVLGNSVRKQNNIFH